MGKKSKRRGGGKPKEIHGTDDSGSDFAAGFDDVFQQIAAYHPPEQIFQEHKVLVTKRLKVATGIGVLDEYRFVFDRLFARVTAAAESIDTLPPDRVSGIDDEVFEVLKEASHDFINSPISSEISKHTHFTTLSTWCKIAMMTCHFDSHLASSEALVPLFDRDAAGLLRRVSSNADEPMPLRTMAMVARATIMFRNCNELNEAAYRRRAKSYFAQIVGSEYPLVSGVEGVIGDLISEAMGIATPDYLSFFSSAVNGIIAMSNDRLTALEGPQRLPRNIDGVGNKSAEQIEYVAKYAFSVGGAFCDHCRKSRQDASVVNLFKCDDCRLAHYCSKNCQKEAWDAGHNQYCRKVGCFTVGDLVIFERRSEGREYATVVERYEDNNMLKCEISGRKETEVVDKKELRHIRPLH